MRPKLWNGPHPVGEALVRGLETTGSPFLSAHTADGCVAGVMDGKGEVKFGQFLRGYIANLKSATLDALGKTYSAIIGRNAAMEWKRKRRVRDFGRYVVSAWQERSPHVWVIEGGELLRFSRTRMTRRTLTAVSGADLNGLPLIVPAPQNPPDGASEDARDRHLFVLAGAKIGHSAGRSQGLVETCYDADELYSGTSGYATARAAGVALSQPSQTVGYAVFFSSVVGNMLQRGRKVTLERESTYATLGDYYDVAINGATYIPPSGSATVTESTGAWLHPIPDANTKIAEVYVKTGGPHPATGTMSFSGYLVGSTEDEEEECRSTVTHYTGASSHSSTDVIAWLGAEVTLAVAMSVTAEHLREASQGQRMVVSPVEIAAANIGWTHSPPSFDYQWRSFDEASSTTPPGGKVGLTCQGESRVDTWSSSSSAVSTINGVEVCRIDFALNGTATAKTGTQFVHDWESNPFEGQPVGFSDPSVNPFHAEWDALLICSRTDPSGELQFTTASSYAEDTSSVGWTFSAKTRDYILFDKVNETYIFLEGTFSGTESSGSVRLDLVVRRAGAEVSYQVREYASASTSFLVSLESVWQQLQYHNPPTPFAGFAPPFCAQGACPYVAYSELANTGDADVFLMSLPLVLQASSLETAPANAFVFDAPTFKGVFGAYAGAGLTAGFWSGFSSEVTTINFADGAFTDWVTGVSPDQYEDETLFSEVYRT